MTQPDPQAPNAFQPPNVPIPQAPLSAPNFGEASAMARGVGAPEFTYRPTSPAMQPETIPSTGPMVFAVLGLFLIGLFGTIPGWVWAQSAIKRARAADIPESSFQQALMARTLGIVGTVIHTLLLIYLIYYAITTFSAAIG